MARTQFDSEKFVNIADEEVAKEIRFYGFSNYQVDKLDARYENDNVVIDCTLTIYGGKRSKRDYLEISIKASLENALYDATISGLAYLGKLVFNYR
ncbi:MAG: hypothetical protein K5906_01695 [Bacilli bacterium]|nr:hypothetical protein [Bacilli bacterium]